MSAGPDRFQPHGGPLLHVDDAGGPGLPVLFQHGLCGDAGQTAEVFPADPAYRRITLEARGHGLSEPGDPGAFSIARFAQDAAELIEAMGLAPLVIGGISMGAAIAMRIAVTRPGLVRGLIIARPAWGTASAPANMRPNAEVGALLARMTQDAARAAFEASSIARAVAPGNLASLRGFFTRQPQAVTAALLQSISVDGPGITEAEMAAITVPTLVIGTRADSIHPVALAEDIARRIPHATLAEITPKARDAALYVSGFQIALTTFLKGFSP